jgi:predicted metal-dependent hydrolase
VEVHYPAGTTITDPAVQAMANRASIRALRAQAETLLPQRLKSLSTQNQISYRSVNIRHLKSRWGSCDQQANITLNLFLIQLPWDLIDYVLLHELTHTKILKHGPEFWQAMTDVMPEVKQTRQRLKNYSPNINGYPLAAMP